MRPVWKSFSLLLVVLAAMPAGCSKKRASPAPKPPARRVDAPCILLITMDTTRADHLGCYGYAGAKTPNLDALAKEGVMFTRAYCQTPMTLPSHASILTGLYPMHHGIRLNGPYRLPDSVPTVAQILQKKGYETVVISKGSYTIVCVGKFTHKNKAQLFAKDLRKKYKDLLVRSL